MDKKAEIISVIDIGSNAIRITVYEKTSRYGFITIHEAKSYVRLGSGGYDKNGAISDVSFDLAYEVLVEFSRIATAFSSGIVRCVATSALRDAKNSPNFIDRVKSGCGIDVEIITGDEEGYYASLAVRSLLPESDGLMVDMGGGSTEIAVIENCEAKKVISLNIGTVRIKEMFLINNKQDEARAYIRKELNKLEFVEGLLFIGVGGTFRTLAKSVKKHRKQSGELLNAYRFGNAEFDAVLIRIDQAKNPSELTQIGIKKERQDIIRAGVMILEEIRNHFKTRAFITSGVGVREGVMLHMTVSTDAKSIRAVNPSIAYIKDRFIKHNINQEKVELLEKVTKALEGSYDFNDAERMYMKTGLELSQCGRTVNAYRHYTGGYNIIKSTMQYCFEHEQIRIIAGLVYFQRKKEIKRAEFLAEQITLLSYEKYAIMIMLIAIVETVYLDLYKDKDVEVEYAKGVLKINALLTNDITAGLRKLSIPKNGVIKKIDF